MHWIDPNHLPRTEGVVHSLLVNPHGKIDGVLLDSGLEVHIPPHMTTALKRTLKPGAKLAVYGVRPRGASMVSAVALEVDDGARILDEGPPGGKKRGPGPSLKHRHLEVEGVIQSLVHGPHGEVRGALLERGPLIRIGPKEAMQFKKVLKAGKPLAVRGPSVSAHGVTVIEASALGLKLDRLTTLKRPPGH